MVAEDNFGILWDSLNFWGSKCFRNIHKCSFESLAPKVLKDISFLFLLRRRASIPSPSARFHARISNHDSELYTPEYIRALSPYIDTPRELVYHITDLTIYTYKRPIQSSVKQRALGCVLAASGRGWEFTQPKRVMLRSSDPYLVRKCVKSERHACISSDGKASDY